MLLTDPLEQESDWTCQTCQHSENSSQVAARTDSALELLERLEGADYEELELAVSRVSLVLHHTHHLRLELDQKLLVRMIKMRGVPSRPVRDRKVQVCQNILSQLRREHSHQLAELVRSEKYLGVREVLVNTQLENLLEDYRGET